MKAKYIAFLRGINVGGHHKVPMAELRKEMEALKFENVVTILNSGNIIFDAAADDLESLERTISVHLEKAFGFQIPVILAKSETICNLLENNPFQDKELTKDLRWYVSFVRGSAGPELEIPWVSSDGSYQIIGKRDSIVFSILDVSISKTPKLMGVLEKSYGKDITTRNWNTINRIAKKLDVNN